MNFRNGFITCSHTPDLIISIYFVCKLFGKSLRRQMSVNVQSTRNRWRIARLEAVMQLSTFTISLAEIQKQMATVTTYIFY